MKRDRMILVLVTAALSGAALLYSQQTGAAKPAVKTITEADCTAAKLGSEIPVGAIGLPVSAITLSAPQWHAEANGVPAYCSIEGSMAPVDKSPTAKPIPSAWRCRPRGRTAARN